jgi:hypothetical protein
VTINFGALPVRASFTVSSDADFYQVVTTDDGTSYPATATMEIRWLDASDVVIDTWSGTRSGANMTFQEDKTVVSAMLDDDPVAARVFYDDGAGGPELLLAQGLVHDLSP